MAIYAIGDIQGCYDQLQQLLDKIKFSPTKDTLWFVGDLVNRGPKSLEVLRFVKSLGKHAVTVLGNHDLHLLAVATGYRKNHKKDTFDAILKAKDRDELLKWLRQRPLLHYDKNLNMVLIHAGLPPQWSIKRAISCANEVESVLHSDQYEKFLAHMYGDEPDLWNNNLKKWDRLRFISNCFTRLRYCNAKGHLILQENDAPQRTPNYIPWFQMTRKSSDTTIIFGHWSTLGFYQNDHVIGLDSGCLWGGKLTAMRLDKLGKKVTISCPQTQDIMASW